MVAQSRRPVQSRGTQHDGNSESSTAGAEDAAVSLGARYRVQSGTRNRPKPSGPDNSSSIGRRYPCMMWRARTMDGTYARCRRLKHAIHMQSRSSGSLWARP